MCYKEEEKHGEKREERQLKRERERDLWEDKRPELVTVRVWGEKKLKGREKKWENLPWEKEATNTLSFPLLQTKIIFIGDATREREIVFQFFFLENNL